ncbi:alpha/beta fold hydrolase [Thermodesulfobacteriota bacterium]
MNSWLDKVEYPFVPRYFEVNAGRLHYVDEGSGDHALLMVHGNPSWSFIYRHLIKGLCSEYRCIAVDHIGFGLSDKPEDWSYLPEEHARNLDALMEHLNPKNVTMVVQDWGGPIGLSYALKHPEKIRSLVIMNTWMWPVKGDRHYERFSGLMGGVVGRFLIRRFNFFVKAVMKEAYGDKSKLTKRIHAEYLNALAVPAERKGCWTFPKQIIGSSEWLGQLWEQRNKIADKPALILWGDKDIAFREKELNTWKQLFHNAEVNRYPDVGHYVQEELGSGLCPVIEEFLSKSGE